MVLYLAETALKLLLNYSGSFSDVGTPISCTIVPTMLLATEKA